MADAQVDWLRLLLLHNITINAKDFDLNPEHMYIL